MSAPIFFRSGIFLKHISFYNPFDITTKVKKRTQSGAFFICRFLGLFFIFSYTLFPISTVSV